MFIPYKESFESIFLTLRIVVSNSIDITKQMIWEGINRMSLSKPRDESIGLNDFDRVCNKLHKITFC